MLPLCVSARIALVVATNERSGEWPLLSRQRRIQATSPLMFTLQLLAEEAIGGYGETPGAAIASDIEPHLRVSSLAEVDGHKGARAQGRQVRRHPISSG